MRRSGGGRAPPPRRPPPPPAPPPPAPHPVKEILKETGKSVLKGAASGAGYTIGSRLTERGLDAVLGPPPCIFDTEIKYEFDTEGGCRAVLVPKAWPDQQGT